MENGCTPLTDPRDYECQEKPSTPKIRVEEELRQLKGKRISLLEFTTTGEYFELSEKQQRLLIIQSMKMEDYIDVLILRLHYWEK